MSVLASRTTIFQTLIFSMVFLITNVHPLSFNFTRFDGNTQNITYGNDSSPVGGVIQLTRSTIGDNLQASVGRVSYLQPVHLWDKNTNEMTNFTTHFSFNITQVGDPRIFGDGFAFFLAPFNDNSTAHAPADSIGRNLGLVGGDVSSNVSSQYPFVAVEFDTFKNSFDPSYDHVGICNTSVVSEAYFNVSDGGLKNRSTAHAWITYDSFAKNLSVYLTFGANPVFSGQSNLSYIIDLSSILPEFVRVGFSAATGGNAELHTIFSWDFKSTMADNTDTGRDSKPGDDTDSKSKRKAGNTADTKSKSKVGLVGGFVACSIVLTIGLGSLVYIWWRWRTGRRRDETNFNVEDVFDNETGPRRFTYNELSRATNNFSEEGKLGEGGFGGVYKGFLIDLTKEIAVKKISKGSKQGKKEYVSEVKIISRLRHKNLVQLLGWCHEQGELLLVYEYMPNGSLDSHLYANKRKAVLPWTLRYKIAQGLASALLYLHEEWEQCVLHRDIKPNNVMLDSSFNAKLGDFGLARLVDHNLGAQTTVLAGTLGYLDPECVITGKATKESDVYSFGVVALEISCGRRPVEPTEDPEKVRMIEWVWHLYGQGRLLEAIDKGLEGEFNVQEIKSLMVVGLWCCHPEYTLRPSMKQVINVLNLESPLPNLPMKFPVPIYFSSPTNFDATYTSSSSGISGNSGTTGS